MIYHHLTNQFDKRIPKGVIVLVIPREKVIAWYYFNKENDLFYGSLVSTKKEITHTIEEEALPIVLEQIKDSLNIIHK